MKIRQLPVAIGFFGTQINKILFHKNINLFVSGYFHSISSAKLPQGEFMPQNGLAHIFSCLPEFSCGNTVTAHRG